MRKEEPSGIRGLARQLGVSPSTVSRALKGQGMVSAALTLRILEAAREAGSVPARKKAALVLPDDDLRNYSLRLMNELRREGRRRGWVLEIISAADVPALDERFLSGVLSMDFGHGLAREWGRQGGVPLVCLNDASSHLDGIVSVYSNEESGVRFAVNHLVGRGHRRIGLLQAGVRDLPSARKRSEGFRRAMAAHGLAAEGWEAWGKTPLEPGITVDGFDAPLGELLAEGITGLIAPGESVAPEIFQTLRRRRIAIPKRLSLILSENPDFTPWCLPPVTTIEQDFAELARAAFDRLEQRLRGEIPLKDTPVDCRIHLRESVDLPPKGPSPSNR